MKLVIQLILFNQIIQTGEGLTTSLIAASSLSSVSFTPPTRKDYLHLIISLTVDDLFLLFADLLSVL